MNKKLKKVTKKSKVFKAPAIKVRATNRLKKNTTKKSIKKIAEKFTWKTKITNKLKKKIMPKITVPKIKGRPKGSKNKKVKAEPAIVAPDIQTKTDKVGELSPESGPVSENAPEILPEFLEIIEGQSYFASSKGRLTNQEIVDNGLEFDRVIGSVWHYKFK